MTDNVIKHYKLINLTTSDGHVYCEIQRRIYTAYHRPGSLPSSCLRNNCENKVTANAQQPLSCGSTTHTQFSSPLGITTSHVACTGPADITNSAHGAVRLGEGGGRDKDIHDCIFPSTKTSSSSKSLLICKRKYIWDGWAVLDVEKKTAHGDDHKESIKSNSMPADACQQLQLLKAMSGEVQTRALSVKIELEFRAKEVQRIACTLCQDRVQPCAKDEVDETGVDGMSERCKGGA
jgi:hypothetical protein